MAEVLPFPHNGELFLDARGPERTMRVSQHPERGLVVVSLWAGASCRASFQLRFSEVARLSELLDAVTVQVDAAAPSDRAPCGSPGKDLPQAS